MTEGPNPLRRFADETWPDERALSRANRVVDGLADRTPTRAVPWLLVGPVLAAAAAALLYVAAPEAPPAAPAALALQFTNSGVAQETSPTPQIQLATNGVGTLSGTATTPVIDLQSGSVKVQVEPHAGIDLRVRTPDGEVAVLGTVFTVDRGPLGTAVAVERGKVAVRCVDGQVHEGLLPGESALCLPTSPEGLLGRASALKESGAPAAELDAAIAAGLVGAQGATRAELLSLRMDEALARADADAALADARAYLDSGETGRRAHALRVAARLSAAQSCEAARPFLDALEALPGGNPEPELSASCPRP